MVVTHAGERTAPAWADALTQALAAVDQRRIATAARLFRQAETRGLPPLSAVEPRWITAMLLGRYERAWGLSDAVLASREGEDFNRPWTPYHSRCVWDGTPLAGQRVLVRCYHGLGDSIQFLRYAKSLAALGCTVLLEIQPALMDLARTCPGVATVVALGDADAALSWDVQVESMELPHALRTTHRTVPDCVPYLGADLPRHRAAGRLRVGLIWQAGGWDERRSLALADLAPLLALRRHVDLLALQPEQDPAWLAAMGLEDASTPGLDAFARVLAGLDLLVTVDTMAAHLGGAMAVPTLVLLHHAADWRWGARGRRTPWYPSMTLLRQPRPGAWTPVVAAACECVTARAGIGRPA